MNATQVKNSLSSFRVRVSQSVTVCLLVFATGCGISPGSLKKLDRKGIDYQRESTKIILKGEKEFSLSVHYSGCGGLYFLKGNDGIYIDPFFSNPRAMKIGTSLMGGGLEGKKKLRPNSSMIDYGVSRIEKQTGPLDQQLRAIFSAHSHYDHLMDIPVLYKKLSGKPPVFLNQSGFNTCYNVLDRARMTVLEEHMSSRQHTGKPIRLPIDGGSILVYPILSEHNPHFKYVKLFSGNHVNPVTDYTDPHAKTRANDWLEGNTFSFLIDYVDDAGEITFRAFVQSSSCNPMAGVPPKELLQQKSVDIAFLGIASYQFSKDYPCRLLSEFENAHSEKRTLIVWTHWEDFFRRYDKNPKTLRGTNVPEFFNLNCVQSYKKNSRMPWPGVTYRISVKVDGQRDQ